MWPSVNDVPGPVFRRTTRPEMSTRSSHSFLSSCRSPQLTRQVGSPRPAKRVPRADRQEQVTLVSGSDGLRTGAEITVNQCLHRDRGKACRDTNGVDKRWPHSPPVVEGGSNERGSGLPECSFSLPLEVLAFVPAGAWACEWSTTGRGRRPHRLRPVHHRCVCQVRRASRMSRRLSLQNEVRGSRRSRMAGMNPM